MKKSPFVFDATPANFNKLVLENSDKGPVLVHYWSPRAGPCMILLPRLIQLATEYGGKFLLVMLNTDEHGRMAKDQGVNSVPTVRFYRNGKMVDAIHGAESNQAFRRILDKYVARESDMAHAISLRAYQEGDVERACALLAKAALDEPANPRIPVDLAKLFIVRGGKDDYAQAEELLKKLPAEIREDAEIAALLAHVGFLCVAQNAPETEVLEQKIAANPADSEARYSLAALKLVNDDYEGAMLQLLEIVRRDRSFRDDAGRKGLIAIFNIPGKTGENNELVARYRALLIETMH